MAAIHYILLRCQSGRAFFREDVEYLTRRQRLVEQIKGEGELLDYCFTPTEIRLLIFLRKGNVPGRFIQTHFSDWLRSLNRRDRRRGYVLAERARIRSIDSSAEIRHVVCFLARYPVDQGLVAVPSAYRHSGHRAHIGLEPAAGLAVRHVISLFGAPILEGREQLRHAVRSFEPTEAEYTSLRTVTSGRRRSTSREPTQPAPSKLALANHPSLFDHIASEVEREVCARHGISPLALFTRPAPPGAAVARSVIVHVLASAKVARLATLARRYQRAPQTIKGEMQRHRGDPASAHLFYLEIEEVLGPDRWKQITTPAHDIS